MKFQKISIMKVLGLILARKGSKGLRNKNIKKLDGYSLVEWSIIAGLESKLIDKIILSSDYSEKKLGNLASNFYWKRPSELAGDKVLSYNVIKDILKNKKLKFKPSYIVLLEPPCPFRNGKLVDKAIELAFEKKASSVVSLKKVEDSHPIRMKKLSKNLMIKSFLFDEPKKGIPRQKQETAFLRDQAVYVLHSDNFLKRQPTLYGSKAFGFKNDKISINIDNQIDYEFAKFLLKNKKKYKNLVMPNAKFFYKNENVIKKKVFLK